MYFDFTIAGTAQKQFPLEREQFTYFLVQQSKIQVGLSRELKQFWKQLIYRPNWCDVYVNWFGILERSWQ